MTLRERKTYVCCNYKPHGNTVSKFSENVFAPESETGFIPKDAEKSNGDFEGKRSYAKALRKEAKKLVEESKNLRARSRNLLSGATSQENGG